jgi:hypothetical protein
MRPFEGSFSASGASKVDLCLADCTINTYGFNLRQGQGTDGPSWLSFIGHMTDSLWSVNLFRCESILLRSLWVMVVMDVVTRRIIGLALSALIPVAPRFVGCSIRSLPDSRFLGT